MYLDKVDGIAKILLDKYPEPDIKAYEIEHCMDYYKKWIRYHVIAKTLLRCYDRLDTDPEDMFYTALLDYEMAYAKTDSLQKRSVYSICVNALQGAYDYVKTV